MTSPLSLVGSNSEPLASQVLAVHESISMRTLATEVLAGTRSEQELVEALIKGETPEDRRLLLDADAEPPLKASEVPAPEFEPLASIDRPSLLPFPVEAMGAVAPFVKALAEHTQTPPDLAGVCVLGFMAGAVARKFQVDAGWREEIALYLAPVAPPGSRKSEVFRRASAPIGEHERQLQDSTAGEIQENQASVKLLEGRLKKVERAYANASDEGSREEAKLEALQVRRELDAVNSGVLRAPRLLAADVTPERLAALAAENQERMILASAEGGQIFDRMFRYSQHGEPNMDFVLSGHNGERCSVDRQNAEPICLKRPVLTIVGTVQPHVLEQLAKHRSFEGRGLLARFAYSIPRDVRGYRDVRSSVAMDLSAEGAYLRTVTRMLDIPHDGENPRVLMVSGAALDTFHAFAQWVEDEQKEDGLFEDSKGWASKAAGLALRIAGVLAVAESPSSPEIDATIMERGTLLGSYFADHSRRAFEMMQGNTGAPAVDKVWRWVTNRADQGANFTRRELWQGTKGGRFSVALDLDKPLAQLRDAGRIARIETEAPRAGRPSEVWAVNPEALR